MTTGTIVFGDTRIFNQTSDCGNSGYLGTYNSKHWDGADLPHGFDRSQPLPPHAYSVTFYNLNYTRFTYQYGVGPLQNGCHPSCFGDWAVPALNASITDASDLKAILRLRDRVDNGSFDLSVFLGTAHQSLHTIAEDSMRLYSAYVAVRHGNVKRALSSLAGHDYYVHPHLSDPIDKFRRQHLPAARRSNSSKVSKAAAANWLELQYAWLPLLNDIFSGAEQLAKTMYRPKSFKTRSSYTQKYSSTVSSGGMYQVYEGRVSVRYIATHTESGTFAEVSGLVNPENLAWELLPWSFVVDWFIPVGNYLEARAFSQRVSGTFQKSVLFTRKGHWVSGAATITGDKSFVNRTDIQRTLPSSLSVPLPRFTPLSEDISWRRAANAVSLMVQGFL